MRRARFDEGIEGNTAPRGHDFEETDAFKGKCGMKKLLQRFAPLERVIA